jgi:hypothetical protein
MSEGLLRRITKSLLGSPFWLQTKIREGGIRMPSFPFANKAEHS